MAFRRDTVSERRLFGAQSPNHGFGNFTSLRRPQSRNQILRCGDPKPRQPIAAILPAQVASVQGWAGSWTIGLRAIETDTTLPFAETCFELRSRQTHGQQRQHCTHDQRSKQHLSNPDQPPRKQPYKNAHVWSDADDRKKPALPATGDQEMTKACTERKMDHAGTFRSMPVLLVLESQVSLKTRPTRLLSRVFQDVPKWVSMLTYWAAPQGMQQLEPLRMGMRSNLEILSQDLSED